MITPITHQAQPTRTSCGPTCVAMLVGVSARRIIDELSAVRSEKRAHKRTHSTNVGEIVRLLKLHGYIVEPRAAGSTLTGNEFGLLRVHRATANGRHRSGWHWCLLADNCVYDPMMHVEMEAVVWLNETRDAKIFFYPLTSPHDVA